MEGLPIREMVLYKHGVGFFVRQGAISGESVALIFHRDAINDALKSLAVFDRSGGQVLGIHYPTPMDKNARLANSSIRLSDQASLRDLLRDLRGRQATLSFQVTPGSLESVTGRVIGLDRPTDLPAQKGQALTVPAQVAILAEDGQVRIFGLDALRALTIHDTQSEHDLRYFLDTSMSEDERRTVTVRLAEGDHNLVVYYVAPSPTWRVSYRLVAESAEGGAAGKALLQGWGLFDNRFDEDLEDVRVTLVAGQPISFIYELYASRIPQRPTVQDEARVAPKPVEYGGGGGLLRRIDKGPAQAAESEGVMAYAANVATGAAPRGRAAGAGDVRSRVQSRLLSELDVSMDTRSPEIRSRLREIFDEVMAEEELPLSRNEKERLFESIAAEPLDLTPNLADLAGALPAQAEGKEAGEFFQYAISTPVSVKRGESALVPILGSEVAYQRELLYNAAKLPVHPVAALRFSNSSGLTLERGPVTVIEDGQYKGEAIVPFVKEGNEVYLPYAVELGVRVTERSQQRTQGVGLHIQDRLIVYEESQVQTVTYAVENTTANDLIVTVEAPILTGLESFDTRPPDVETARERRWRVEAPARSRVEFVRKERHRTQRTEEIRRLDADRLQRYLENRWLDRETFDRLSEMIRNLAAIQKIRVEQQYLRPERAELYKKQEQLRANLSSLQPTGQEAALRKRMLDQLEAAQDRLEAIDARLAELDRQAAEAEAQVEAIIEGLG